MVGLTALAAAAVPAAGAASADDGWRGGFEDGTTDAWQTEQESAPDRIEVVDDVDGLGRALDGRYAARILCGPRDRGSFGSGGAWRTELRASDAATAAHHGNQAWYEFRYLLGDDFETPSRPGDWAVITQFHADASAPPVVAFEIDDHDRLSLRVRGGSSTDPRTSLTTMVPDLRRGRAYHVEMHARWSSSGDGRVRVWVDGQPVTDVRGPNLYRSTRAALKVGCYRSAADVGEGTLWVDGIRRLSSRPGGVAAEHHGPSGPPEPSEVIRVSGRDDRTEHVGLAGEVLDQDHALYVFVDRNDLRAVRFFLDDRPVRTEQQAPFDFEVSTRAAAPLRLLRPGAHVIAAELTYLDGRSERVEAPFRLIRPPWW